MVSQKKLNLHLPHSQVKRIVKSQTGDQIRVGKDAINFIIDATEEMIEFVTNKTVLFLEKANRKTIQKSKIEAILDDVEYPFISSFFPTSANADTLYDSRIRYAIMRAKNYSDNNISQKAIKFLKRKATDFIVNLTLSTAVLLRSISAGSDKDKQRKTIKKRFVEATHKIGLYSIGMQA